MKKIYLHLIIIGLTSLLFSQCSIINNVTGKNKKMEKTIETTEGKIKIRLYDETPLHKANFDKLCNEKFYDGIIFHRVIKGFMIQTGDPASKNPTPEGRYGSGGPGYTIPAEFVPTLFHKKGAIAAARMGDMGNPEKASSGSQFYIVVGEVYTLDKLKKLEANMQRSIPEFKFSEEAIQAYTTIGGTPHLDGAYTVFGEVVEGIEVVDKIAKTPTGSMDRPNTDIFITKAK